MASQRRYYELSYLCVVLCSLEALPSETRQMVQQRVLFEDLYEVCGGSIYLMNVFLDEYIAVGGEKLTDFSQVRFSFFFQLLYFSRISFFSGPECKLFEHLSFQL